MTTHGYPRARNVAATLTDLLMVAVLVGIVAGIFSGTLAHALGAGIVCVLVMSVTTLHHPRQVDIDEQGVSFHAYGRVHRYAWRDVERVDVRRFVVSDRVLVRLSPSPPWRGCYWLHEPIEGYRELVAAFVQRARPNDAASTPRSQPPARR